MTTVALDATYGSLYLRRESVAQGRSTLLYAEGFMNCLHG
jgi:hypothetical protein